MTEKQSIPLEKKENPKGELDTQNGGDILTQIPGELDETAQRILEALEMDLEKMLGDS